MPGQWKSRPRLRRDWEPRLSAWAERAMALPHALGSHDCLLAALGAVEAQTGRDFARGHRGRWRTRKEAIAYLRELGFASLEALLDSLLDRVPVAFAQRGDLVLAHKTPGVCLGGTALIVHPGGPLFAPRSAWTRAWSVGRREAGAGPSSADAPAGAGSAPSPGGKVKKAKAKPGPLQSNTLER